MQDTELSRVRKFESFEDQTTAKQTGVSRSQARTNNLTARVFWGTLIVFFSAAITASSLLLVVLVDKTAQESGIATLTVSFGLFKVQVHANFRGERLFPSGAHYPFSSLTSL